MRGAILPASEVLLRHGPHAVTLRASLRVAVALADYPEGFGGLFRQIGGQSLTAIYVVIRAAATDRREAEALIAYAGVNPLAPLVMGAQAACLALLSVILTPAQGETATETDVGPVKPMAEYFEDLYRYGTAWLGWPPSGVWNASIAELEAAVMAHFDRLMMLMPGVGEAQASTAPEYTPERLREIEEQGFDPVFDREALRTLKARQQ